MVDVELHGILSEKMNKNKWRLAVNSASEAIRAIEANTKTFYKTLIKLDEQNIKYRILINKKDFKYFKNEEDIKNDFEKAFNSNLITNFEEEELQSVDIVPVLEGAGGGLMATIAGIVVAVIGVVLMVFPVTAPFGAAIFIAGIGLAAAGFLSLMSSPPPYVAPEFASPDVAGSKSGGGKSYLFDGPTNTAGEGGPIPIGYGRLTVGSKTISATYSPNYVPNSSAQRTT
jgi:predicted phage tail protein